MEFQDKKVAKYVAAVFNNQKIGILFHINPKINPYLKVVKEEVSILKIH